MTPEGKVKQFVKRLMSKWFPDAVYYAPPGGPFGRGGFPDRMWFIRANDYSTIVVAIETKSESNPNPTELQLKSLISLARQGVISAVVVGKDLEHMRRIRDEIYRRLRLAAEKPRP